MCSLGKPVKPDAVITEYTRDGSNYLVEYEVTPRFD